MPKCKSCGAPITFQSTANGKLMPVEPGVVSILTREGDIVKGFIPHWLHCPHADKHRGRGNRHPPPKK